MNRTSIGNLVWKHRTLCSALLMLGTTAVQMEAQTAAKNFTPFDNFINTVKSSNAHELMARPEAKLRETAKFEEMRQHVLNLYAGVRPTHSFALDGDTFDCVPTSQQPSVRLLGLKGIATPPPANAVAGRPGGSSSPTKPVAGLPSQVGPDRAFDELGNSRVCEAETIPMRRVTLEEMSRFESLKNYMEKGPNGTGQATLQNNPVRKVEPVVKNDLLQQGGAGLKIVPPSPIAHKYSYTYQYVNNLGQTDTISLWSPYVYTGLGEIFSLAQSWTIGYSPVLQTAEVGWQNYPALYGGENSRLFIYWTADGYSRTGCYNLSCGAFVQTNNSWYFGAGFGQYSTVGGPQIEFRAQFYLYAGNWWLGLGNANSITWVGYYPATLYGTGPMRTHSQLLEFGSESVGTNPWPSEGSGQWASAGWSRAAYQRELYYWSYPSAGAVWDSLTAAQPSSNCYTIAGPYWGGYAPPSNDWGEYFYFGGPGGYNCY